MPTCLTTERLYRRYHLLLLFCIGFFVIAITAVRLSQSYSHPESQTQRWTWFAAETLAATLVCQAPMIYGMLRKHHYTSPKPQKGPGYSPSPSDSANSSTVKHQIGQVDGHFGPEQEKAYEQPYYAGNEENGGIVVTRSFVASSGSST